MSEPIAYKNTDRELWREQGDFYSPSIFVTEGGGIGISVGGLVYVRPVREWHGLVDETERLAEKLRALGCEP